ncbi:hypothetical protein MHTCC0001_34600 [Flavobacteriaceae bacterium MHTCC 0001]
MTMSPDGKEHFFTKTDSTYWFYEGILQVKTGPNNEIVVDTPQFVRDFVFDTVPFIGEPMIAPNNKDLYFVANYPTDFYRSQRTASGEWSKAVRMDSISSEGKDWYLTASKNNTLYFADGEALYKSIDENGKHNSRIKLKEGFNQPKIYDPCISKNEDYMIFVSSTREDGFGKSDLYVSFKDENGNWLDPINLGSTINSECEEFAPYISPDEKFLFFSKREKWNNPAFSNIYWVSLKIIDQYRNQ